MATMTTVNGQFLLTHTITHSGPTVTTLTTQNKFVEHDIVINFNTPDAGSPTLEINNKSEELVLTNSMLTNGTYYPTMGLNGHIYFDNAGWVTDNTYTVVDNSVLLGGIPQSSLSTNSIAPTTSVQTVTISKGYYPEERTITIGSSTSSEPADITSGIITLEDLNFTPTESSFQLNITAMADIPTVNSAGYISAGANTLHSSTNTIIQNIPKIGVGVVVDGNTDITPSIMCHTFSINGVIDAAGGTASTSMPVSGPYIKVKSNSTNSTVSALATVTTAGYGTTSTYNADAPTITTVNINESSDTYIPITTTSINVQSDSTPENNIVSWNSGWISQGSISSGNIVLSGSTTITPQFAIETTSNTYQINIAAIESTIPQNEYFIPISTTISTASLLPTIASFETGYLGNTTQITGMVTINSSYLDQYITIPKGNITVSTNNPDTTGTTYTIPTNAPVLIDGGFLVISEGYYPPTKISTATLVPDGTDIQGHSEYILVGHTALDEDGTLVTGSMPIYSGYYDVEIT